MGDPYWLTVVESMISISESTTTTVAIGFESALALKQPARGEIRRKGIILMNVFMGDLH